MELGTLAQNTEESMESPYPSFPTLFLFTISVILTIKFLIRKTEKSSLFPPEPRKLPIIGHLHLLVGSLPHRRLRDLAKLHGPIMRLQLGEVSTVVISSPEAAKEFFKKHELSFANRAKLVSTAIISYNYKDLVYAPYGEYWRETRKICTQELLSSRKVQSFQFIREEEASDLVKSIAQDAGSVINLSQKISMMITNVTARTAFGMKTEAAVTMEFISYVKELTAIVAGFSLADAFPNSKLAQWIGGTKSKAHKLFQISDKILEDIINNHRKRDTEITTMVEEADYEDLVDVLLKYLEDPHAKFQLTVENIKAVIMDIFVGGETQTPVIEWAMSEMLKNPRLIDKAQAEVRRVYAGKGAVDETGLRDLKFLRLIIKETLRVHPVLPLLLPRDSSERCQFSGYELPVKTRAIINLWAIGRDHNYWREAETFDPDRFLDSSVDFRGSNFEYIPFSAGRRICPGMSFGLATIELTLATLLFHFDWLLPNGQSPEELDMTEKFSVSVGRKYGLRVIPVPCSSVKFST